MELKEGIYGINILSGCTEHYSYDIHGNVKTLIQDNKKLADSSSIEDQRFKKLDYEYDLISGNVHKVSYQKDSADAFHHRYEYDADNRITEVQTSNHYNPDPNTSSLWDTDAKYFYYAHGPLARVEIGDNQVQGLDYVYTLQGWIKGVNSNTLDSLRDAGRDGLRDSSHVNLNFPKDVYGYSLNYFSGDYSSIATIHDTLKFYADITGSDIENNRHDLYNGNIGSMVTTITNPTTKEVLPLGNAYKYDQLNRLMQSRSFTNLNSSTNKWDSTGTYNGMYFNAFNYDANGNILGQLRKDHNGSVIDSLTYRYARNSNDQIIKNRLYHVNDTTDYNTNDIDDMGVFDPTDVNANNNYKYTEIGELKFDKQEEISEIEWMVNGKVKAIYRPDTSSKKELKFDYDAMGQRVAKHIYSSAGVWEKTTYYIRDASGNVMSVYEHQIDDSSATISYKQKEQHIYGSSRVGMRTDTLEMIGATIDTSNWERILGKKYYELSNHLGNVLSVISDKKIAVDDDANDTVDYFYAEIISATDYSPFGVVLEERDFNSSAYRYSFQNQEQDGDIKGEGNSINFEYRMHDPRLGRFFKIDPLAAKYSWNSPYAFAENRVIDGIELEGAEWAIPRAIPYIPEFVIPRMPIPPTIPVPPVMPHPPISPTQPLSPAIPNIPKAPATPIIPNRPGVPIDRMVGEDGIDWSNPPATPEELPAEWQETTDPRNESGSRTFENKETGHQIRWDPSRPGKGGNRENNHWHRLNPNKSNKHDQYLDRYGNPVGRGSEDSHIEAGSKINILPAIDVIGDKTAAQQNTQDAASKAGQMINYKAQMMLYKSQLKEYKKQMKEYKKQMKEHNKKMKEYNENNSGPEA